MYNINHNFNNNFPLNDLIKGWKRGKNRAKNIKLPNGKKVNIAGYCMINNICMHNLSLKGRK